MLSLELWSKRILPYLVENAIRDSKHTLGLKQGLGYFSCSGANYGFVAWQESNDQVWARLLQAESCATQFALMSFPCDICS